MKVTVKLAISSDDYLAHYQGVAQAVVAQDEKGRNIRFPADILRSFVTREGIYGTFEISFDDNNKFKDIRKI